MVNVRLCFMKMGWWLNYIIFVGCLYAINTDALPVLFLDGSPHLQGLLKLLGRGRTKMTLDDIIYSFDEATEVLCISNEEVQKIKQRYTLIGNQTDEDKWVAALKEIATDHRDVVFTLLRLNRFKLPTDEVEYKSAIKSLNNMEGSKSPEVVAAIEAGEKETSINKGAKDYSEAFRGICKAWFGEMNAYDNALLDKLEMNPPTTLLELNLIFRRFRGLLRGIINDYQGNITDFQDRITDFQDRITDYRLVVVAKEALADLRRRLEIMEIMSLPPLLHYSYQNIIGMIRKMLAIEDKFGKEFSHLSAAELDTICNEQLEILPKKLKDFKDAKPLANDTEGKQLSASEMLKLIENTQAKEELFVDLQKKMYKHYALCRFMLLASEKSTQIDFILKVIKEDGITQNKFCISWMLSYHITSFFTHQPKVYLKLSVTREEKIQALKNYTEEVGFPEVYNLAKIIYNLPDDPPTKVKQVAETFMATKKTINT